MVKPQTNHIKEILKISYELSDKDIDCYLEILENGGMYKGDILQGGKYDEDVIKRLEDSRLIRRFPQSGTLYIPTPPQEIALKVIDSVVDTLIQIQGTRRKSILKEISGVLVFSEQNKRKGGTEKNLSAAIVRDIIENVNPGAQIRLRVRKLSTFDPKVYSDFVEHIITKDLEVKVLLVSEKETPYKTGINRAKKILSMITESETGNSDRFQVRISNRKSEHLRYLLAEDIVMFVVGTSPSHTGIIIEDEQVNKIFERDFEMEFKNATPLQEYLGRIETNRERELYLKG